jgi:large subunit ribosomal protein L1
MVLVRLRGSLVFCTPDKEQEAKDAGADFVGLNDLVDKVLGGWTDMDVSDCYAHR